MLADGEPAVTPDETIRFLESNLERQLGWIAAADKKASFIFAVNTAMMGVLAAISPGNIESWGSAPGFLASVTTMLSLVCFGFIVASAFPRTAGPERSLIYFGKAANLTIEQYHSVVCDLSEADYIRDLSDQTHRNAQIASSKYGLVQHANRFLFIAVPIWLFTILLLYSQPATPV